MIRKTGTHFSGSCSKTQYEKAQPAFGAEWAFVFLAAGAKRLRRDQAGRRALLVPGIKVVARAARRSGHVVGARAMRPAAAARITLAATTALKARAAIDLRLRSGDEGWQAIDAARVRYHRLRLRWLRLVLRLRAMLAIAVMFARLLGALIGLALALIVVAHERLRLLRRQSL